MNETPVVILCGGQGTRMREETVLKPKPMVEIGGKPILWHLIKYYSSFGFSNFILALGYKGEVIKKYFYEYPVLASDFTITFDPNVSPKIHSFSNNDSHLKITCIDTGESNQKGSRIKQVEPYIHTNHFHCTYGDGLCNVDLKKLEDFHLSHSAISTLTAVNPPSRFGEIDISPDFIVQKFEEKPQMKTGYINGGFFVFDKSIMNFLSLDKNSDLEFGALKQISQKKKLFAFKHDGFWQCMDNVRERDYLENLWANENTPWKVW